MLANWTRLMRWAYGGKKLDGVEKPSSIIVGYT